jgi:hypothetical protein
MELRTAGVVQAHDLAIENRLAVELDVDCGG